MTNAHSTLLDVLSTLVAAQDAARGEQERADAPVDERHPYHTSAEALGAYLGVRGHRLTVDTEGGPRRPVRVLTLRPQAEAPTTHTIGYSGAVRVTWACWSCERDIKQGEAAARAAGNL